MSNLADAIFEEGYKDATKEVSLNLYKNFNMPIEKIAEIVKFPKDDIQTWIDEVEKA